MSLLQLCQEAARTTRSRSAVNSNSARPAAPSPPASRETSKTQQLVPRLMAVAVGEDGRPRCPWGSAFVGASSEPYVLYHDTEWGRPKRDDVELFELLVLEGAQAGLSWSTILKKREAYRRAFQGFDPAKVATYGDKEVEQLLSADSGIVRHRGKVQSAISNARCVLKIQQVHGSFSSWVWSFVDGQEIINSWSEISQVPTTTSISKRMSAAMKQEGFSFVGPVTCYSFMQAAGLVNDHLTGCFCHPGYRGGAGT